MSTIFIIIMPDWNYAIFKIILLAWLFIAAIAMFNDDSWAFDTFHASLLPLPTLVLIAI